MENKSTPIKTAKVIALSDLGMVATHAFNVVDMLVAVAVAVKSGRTSAHITGSAIWRKKIAASEFKHIAFTAA
jgi:fumarate hydratase class I